MKKRVLSILLCLCMVLMLCPVTAFADEHVYRVAGDPLLCGSDWDPADDNNRMTYNGETGRYEKVYTGVGPWLYWYEITVDGAWSDVLGVSRTVDVENDNATVTIWYDEKTGEWGADVVYGTPAAPDLAITVDGFEVGNTPADCTYSFESTIPGVTFSEDDLELVIWDRRDNDMADWASVLDGEAFRADTRYQITLSLDGKGLTQVPAVTINGKTLKSWYFIPEDGVLVMVCDLGTPALTLTIDGPDVVCSWQDYAFTVTPPAGVTLEESFGYDTGMKSGLADLEIDDDGVGHGTVLTGWYDLQTNRFTLTAHGTTAGGTPVTGTKTVEVSPEHIFVDGVCGCGVKQQYIVTYDPGEYGTGSIEAGVKTYDEPFTLSSETFKREGYVQTGWRDANYWMYFALGDTYYADEDVTLYPIWDEVITLTVPYTTTVKLGDVGVPGETTFDLAIVGASTGEENYADVTVSGSVTTNGAGDYEGTLTFTGPFDQLWNMLSEGAFVQQVNAGEDGWTVDDTVWGVLMEEIPVAYAMGDDATASGYTVYVVPASVDGNGYYYIDWENLETADMCFTNTYTAHVYALNHDADGHWDECAGCKDKQNEEPHTFGDWKVTKEATQTAKGEKEHTCTVCGYTEKAEIPMRTNVPTGDDSSFALWAALFTLSAAAVTATATMGKRKKAEK